MQQAEDIFRVASSSKEANEDLGLLHNLPGTWIGKGFNLIARPAHEGEEGKPPFFLELNATQETLEFTAIGGAIPNRGDVQKTKLLHAVHYLQTVADCADNTFIHKEPGLWVHVPPLPDDASERYVRHAVIPHGDSLLAQSTFFTTLKEEGPRIEHVNSLPFPIGDPIPDLNDVVHRTDENPEYIGPFEKEPLPGECLPPGLQAAKTIRDPTEVLRAQIAGQKFIETDVIVISTEPAEDENPPAGGILNIPFVIKNANAKQMDAIFWIEKVERPGYDPRRDRNFLQLQYVQRVILDFGPLHWPHVSVATLVKTA